MLDIFFYRLSLFIIHYSEFSSTWLGFSFTVLLHVLLDAENDFFWLCNQIWLGFIFIVLHFVLLGGTVFLLRLFDAFYWILKTLSLGFAIVSDQG